MKLISVIYSTFQIGNSPLSYILNGLAIDNFIRNVFMMRHEGKSERIKFRLMQSLQCSLTESLSPGLAISL
jgi:hypothetical protein